MKSPIIWLKMILKFIIINFRLQKTDSKQLKSSLLLSITVKWYKNNAKTSLFGPKWGLSDSNMSEEIFSASQNKSYGTVWSYLGTECWSNTQFRMKFFFNQIICPSLCKRETGRLVFLFICKEKCVQLKTNTSRALNGLLATDNNQP